MSGGQQQRVALARALAISPARAAAGRAAVGAGRQGARAAARRDPADPAGARRHNGFRDPRPGGGAVDGRPGRRHARRPARAVRRPQRALRPAGHAVRRRVRRHDEPARRHGRRRTARSRSGGSCCRPTATCRPAAPRSRCWSGPEAVVVDAGRGRRRRWWTRRPSAARRSRLVLRRRRRLDACWPTSPRTGPAELAAGHAGSRPACSTGRSCWPPADAATPPPTRHDDRPRRACGRVRRDPGGYRRIEPGAGRAARRPRPTSSARWPTAAAGEPLLTVAHLSDLHVCDHQSPARVEFLDRWADPDSPILEHLGEVGAYRSQELLTAQVVEAGVRAVNAVEPRAGARRRRSTWPSPPATTPTTRRPTSWTWYLTLLDGGRVAPGLRRPDPVRGRRGRRDRRRALLAPERRTATTCRARSTGSLRCQGFWTRCAAPFDAAGLRLPWLAVHGNHDRLLQGTVPGAGLLGDGRGRRPQADRAARALDHRAGAGADGRARALRPQGAGRAGRPPQMREVTADAGRRIVDPQGVRRPPT